MNGDDLPTLILEGRAAARAGDFARCLAKAQARLAAAPGDLDAVELKALAQRALGDAEGAAASLQAALALDPGAAWAHGDLIRLLYEAGDIDGAEAAARAGLAAVPELADAHNLLGAMRSERDDLPDGEAHLRRALALTNGHPLVQRNLAVNLARQGRVAEAGALFEAVLARHPGDGEAMAQWARALEQQGAHEEALALLARAEKAGRDVSLQRAVTLSAMGAHEAAVAVIDGARGLAGGDALLARGRALDALGRFDEAWACFTAGKAKLAQRDRAQYDADGVRAQFSTIAAAAREHEAAATPEEAALPLFIVGFPRSGTTMMEQMLSSHSMVRAGGELPFAHEWAQALRVMVGSDYPLALARLNAKHASEASGLLADVYLERASAYGLTHGAVYFTDKMPLNEIYLPLIRLAFPRSPIVRMIRHPLDLCVSMISHNMTHGGHCAYSLEDIAAHLIAVNALTDALRAVCGERMLEVRYEDFVTDQEHWTRAILTHAGLEFEGACLSFHANARIAPTPSYAQVRQPLNSRSIGRWRSYERHLAPVMERLAPLAAHQGYAI